MTRPPSIIILFLTLAFLAAGCNPFSQPVAAGIVKTTNGGADWQFINKLGDGQTGSLAEATVSELVFDPYNSEHVYAGSYSSGLFKSEDTGNSWKQILSKIGVYDVVINPQDTKVIYAAGFFNNHGKVLVSKNTGGSWDEIFNEEDVQNPVRSIALNPSNPFDVVIGLNSGNLVKSSDGGQHWRLLLNFQDQINRVRWQNGGLYVLLEKTGLRKSTDGGLTFQDLSGALAASRDFAGVPVSGPAAGNFNRMAIDAINPSLIYLTTDAGLYKTVDEGQTWRNLTNLPLKDSVVPVRAVAISRASSNTVYASAGATVYKTLDGGSSWQTQSVATTGFVNVILVHPQLPQIAYAGIFSE